MKSKLLFFAVVLAFALPASAATRSWTNTAGGNWFVAANWSPNAVPNVLDTANITNNGTYTVNILTGAVSVAAINLGGASGSQTLLNGTVNNLVVTNLGTVRANGILSITSGGLQGNVTIQPSGQLDLATAANKNLYSLTLNNQGTVSWSGGFLLGGSTPSTVISNGGLWQITSDNQFYNYYGNTMLWTNAGTLRKAAGRGSSLLNGFNFVNQPTGILEALSGTLSLGSVNNSVLGGLLTATTPGLLTLNGGVWTDAGGAAAGTGTNQFASGTLNLRTNIIAGLRLVGGEVYVTGTNTFQQAGAITNLTLDGSQLRGTNRVGSGLLTINAGGVDGLLTVLSPGQVALATAANKNLYSLTLNNQGTVSWSGGFLLGGSTPSTVISNGGLWQITSDNQFYNYYGNTMFWTNAGTLRKAAGPGSSLLNGFNFVNQPTGILEALSGTLSLGSVNNSVLGGLLTATTPGLLTLAGGVWTDAGGAAAGTGTNQFASGTLNLRTNIIAGLRLVGGEVYVTGTNTFQQAGTITNLTLDGSQLRGTNRVGSGLLTINAGGVDGLLTVLSPGQVALATAANKNLYSLTLNNQGTVSWSGGFLLGGSTPSTVISNGGLWQITSDNQFYNYYGNTMLWTNAGTLRKAAGPGSSLLNGFNFVNQPTGILEALSGTLSLGSVNNSVLGGLLTATTPGLLTLAGGVWTDAGGAAAGTGTNQFASGTLNLRTNIIAGLRLVGGEVYVTGTNTFQQAGTITNLTLDGSQLRGTNRVGSGLLTINAGGVDGLLTVLSPGQVALATAANKNLYSLTLNNQGTVSWSGGFLLGGSTPSTVISNGGLWQITSDNQFYNYYGNTMLWTNAGTLRKAAGSGSSLLNGFNFVNQPTGILEALSGTLSLGSVNNSVLGGLLTATTPGLLTLAGGVWTDAGGAAAGTGTNQFASGTLNLRTNIIAGLRLVGGEVYVTGTNTFQQAGTITNLTLDGSQLRGTNRVGSGLLTINAGGVDGLLTVLSPGQVALATAANKNLYSLTLNNQGTVSWSGGFLLGGSTPSTVISNGGLWQITSDNQFYNYYGNTMLWTNAGTLRKAAGPGSSLLNGFNFVNQPTGIIEALSGTLSLGSVNNSVLGGLLTATTPGLLTLSGGVWTDAGGAAAGTGTNQFASGTLNLRTNIIAGLRLVGGEVYVTGTNTFQQAGTITNLTLDGSQLRGTNRVGSGLLTINAGGVDGLLTVLSPGQVALATAANKNLYSLTLNNQGTVSWSGGFLLGGSTPSTVISNGGLWQITSDNQFYNYYGNTMFWTNTGTLRKSAGSGSSLLNGFNFVNQPSGLIQADVGTLSLPSPITNSAGTLRLNGGTIQSGGTYGMTGGTLEGAGAFGANAITGGIVTPGQAGPGLVGFSAGLNFGSGATLSMSGTGTIPGTQYDQLSVTGAVALANATLQVTSLPAVAAGTTFVLVLNDGADAVSGTFNGLAENALVPVGAQSFRIHYAGGSGNDVTLVRDSGSITLGPLLSSGNYSGGTFQLLGSGSNGVIYRVQATTNFVQWTNIGFATGGVSGNLLFNDTNAFRYQYRFYRTTN